MLFGSYASGAPTADSDVDLLVVADIPTDTAQAAAAEMRRRTTHPFPLDLLVRTPKNLAWRLAEGDSFLREVMDWGKILYEKTDGQLGPQGRRGLPRRTETRPKPATGK